MYTKVRRIKLPFLIICIIQPERNRIEAKNLFFSTSSGWWIFESLGKLSFTFHLFYFSLSSTDGDWKPYNENDTRTKNKPLKNPPTTQRTFDLDATSTVRIHDSEVQYLNGNTWKKLTLGAMKKRTLISRESLFKLHRMLHLGDPKGTKFSVVSIKTCF